MLSLVFSGRYRSQSIGLILACLLMLPRSGMAQECPQEPSTEVPLRDRTLVVMVYDRSDETWGTFEVKPRGEPPTISFNQNRLCFLYGVKSHPERTGALIIRVVRRFELAIGESSKLVFMNRERGFFHSNWTEKESWKGQVTFNFYQQFHREKLSDPDFRDKFHGYWRTDKGSNTAIPKSRLNAFSYGRAESTTVLRRTYLLHYNTSSTGSWIPFYLETAGAPQHLKQVDLVVWDFGSSTEEPVLTGRVER